MDDNTRKRLQQAFGANSGIAVGESEPAKKTSGRGGFLSALISEGGGTAGAIGGAAAGTAILPGIGTLIGGGLGGLLGGFAGKGAENKVRDDQNLLGKGGSASAALGEGALEGIFAGLPIGKIFKGLKGGAKGAGSLLTKKIGAEGAEQIVKEGAEKKAKSGLLDKVGKFGLRQEGAAKGITAGTRVGGRDLTLSQADDLTKWTSKFKAGTPTQILEELEPAIKNKTQELATILSKSTAKVGKRQINSIKKEMLEKVGKEVPTLIDNPKVGTLINRFSNAKNVKDIDDARKVADKFINFGRNSAKNPELEQAARVIRDIADKAITQLAPDSKAAKTFISKGLDAQAAILRAAKPSGFGDNILTTIAGSSPSEGARSIAGRSIQKLAGAGAGRETAEQIAKQAAGGVTPLGLTGKVIAGSTLANGLQAPEEDASLLTNTGEMEQESELDSSLGELGGADTASAGLGGIDTATLNKALQQAALQALSAGDTKGLDRIMKVAALFEKFSEMQGGADDGDDGLNATQKKDKNNALSALKDIDLIQEQIRSDSGAVLKSKLPGGGFTQRLTGSSQIAAAQENVVDAIARLRSGAAITEDEAKRYMSLLPGSFDTPEAASDKLIRLKELLTSFTYPSGGGGEDNISALEGLQ
jgi:hypothetical protein